MNIMQLDLLKNIEHTYRAFQTLRFYFRTDDSRIYMQIEVVDNLISNLMNEYNYTPDFVKEFDRIVLDYFEACQVNYISKFADVSVFSIN